MKGTSTSFRSNDKPSVIWSLVAKQREEVHAKAFRRPVGSAISSNIKVHFLHKAPIEQIEGTLVDVVTHVLDIGHQWPVHCLGPEDNLSILLE